MSLKGIILSFVGEKWQILPFPGRTRTLVPVPKVRVPVPLDSEGLVPVPMLSATLFLHTLHY